MANNAFRKRRRPPPESSICYPPPIFYGGPPPPGPPHEQFPCSPPPLHVFLHIITFQSGSWEQEDMVGSILQPNGDYTHSELALSGNTLTLTVYTANGIPQADASVAKPDGTTRSWHFDPTSEIYDWNCQDKLFEAADHLPADLPDWPADQWYVRMDQST